MAYRAAAIALCGAAIAATVRADSNIPHPVDELEQRLQSRPFTLVEARQSRPLKDDVALRADVRFDDGMLMRIKIRRAAPGAAEFNNQPRYELAAYELQKLFLDPDGYVVPPTAIRALPLDMIKPYARAARATFPGTTDVFAVVQFWLASVEARQQPYDAGRFASNAAYARHIANLNVLTYLIRHGDANYGNVLSSSDPANPRVFLVDSGIAFASPDSDRGVFWRILHVPSIPAATVERLRRMDRAAMERALCVVGQWERQGERMVAVAQGAAINASMGVRRRMPVVQMGLTRREVAEVDKRRVKLLERVDRGELRTF
jgi:hypothetical protein